MTIRFGKTEVYKYQKFIDEEMHLGLVGHISRALKKYVNCSLLSDVEWSPIWDKLKKSVVIGHQVKRSEHGTKMRNTFYGE